MILKLLLATPLILILQTVLAQNTFDLKQARSHYLEFSDKKFSSKEKIPFRNVLVSDYRFDTTKAGYIKENGNINRILIGDSGSLSLTKAFNLYFRDNLNPLADNALLILIKTLWIYDEARDLLSEQKIRHQFEVSGLWSPKDPVGACLAEIEAFAMTGDQLKPIVRIKDIFFDAPCKLKKAEAFITLPFDSLFKKIIATDIPALLETRKTFSWETVHSAALKRYEIPVLKEPAKKGVFLTFDAFRQNKPDHATFIIKDSGITDELYIKNGNNEDLLTEFWGFCDGTDFYVKSGYNFFKMLRQNNTWDFLGSKYVSLNYGSNNFAAGNMRITTQKLKSRLPLKPLQLNMETGKPF